MTDDTLERDDSPEDERFAGALEEYYRQRAREEVDAHEFASRFPDIYSQLLAYLLAVEDIRRLAPTLPNAPLADPEAPQAPLETIRYFGDYELLTEIARGGMGVVYRARQVSLNRIVAVKMILAGRLASEEDVARFRLEAMGAARLRHPNVVAIYEIGEHEGQHFFSMEYIEGWNLAQLVRENPISGTRAAEFAQIIAEAMSVVHREGLLHRDLKPSNVLIEAATSRVRITDFGLVKSTDAETMFTTTGQLLGTPSYMAPEQAAGRRDLVGPASDTYAIGAILYELATGRPPFLGETPWDTAWQVRTCEVVPPRSLNPKLSRDLETICLKCLQKEIPRRYASAQDLADDLGRLLRNEPILARPVSRWERGWRWCRRNPALAAAIAAAAVGFLGLLISLTLFADAQRNHAQTMSDALKISEHRRREGNLRLAETERDKGLRLCDQGDIDQGCLWLARSLATAPEDAADLRWSIRMNLAAWQRELCVLQRVFPGASTAPRFSRDGLRFATSLIKPPVAGVHDAATGNLVGPPMPHQSRLVELLFGADHHTLLVKSGNKGLSLWRETGEAWAERVLRDADFFHITDENRVLTAEWQTVGYLVKDALTNETMGKLLRTESPGNMIISPNGELALTRSKSDRMVLTNLATGEPRGSPLVHPGRVTIVHPPTGDLAAAFSPDSKLLAVGYEMELGNGRKVPHAQVWDTATATKKGSPLKHEEDEYLLERVAFNNTGRRLFTATRSKLRVWDGDGKLLAGPLPHGGSRFSISDEGRLLAYVSPGREARLWDVDAQRTIAQPLARRLGAHFVSDVPNAVISPDGGLVLAATPQQTSLWRAPPRGRLSPTWKHGDVAPEILWLDFSRDSSRLLSTSYAEGTARVWDVHRQVAVGKPWRAPYGIQCRAISPDGRWAAIGSMQGANHFRLPSVSVWNVETGESSARNLPKYDEVTHWVAFSHNGKLLTTAGDRGLLHVYDLNQDEILAGPLKHPMSEVEGQQMFFLLSPDDQRIAVLTRYDSSASLWGFPTGKPICEPLQLAGRVYSLAFSPDSQMLALVGNEIALHNAQTGVRLPLAFASPAKATDAVFSPDGKWLATVHEDRTARVWDTSTGQLVGPGSQHSEPVGQIAFAAQGRLLLTGTRAGGYLWDPFSGTQVGPTFNCLGTLAASPDGRIIVTSAGPEFSLWEVPQPVADDAAVIMRQIESATGLLIDEQQRIQPLPDKR